jgi:hypothetical protein
MICSGVCRLRRFRFVSLIENLLGRTAR